MAERRDLLAVQIIVVTFAAAVRSFMTMPDRDIRVLLTEQARDRALHLLDTTAAHLPYEPGTPLDRAIKEARRRIESEALTPS